MTPSTVEVTTPSRLHFGMLAFGQPEGRQFGGLGAMIDQPGLRLRLSGADQFAAAGPLATRIERAARRVADHWQLPALPRCRVEVLSAPPQHVGLGSGTQLALAVVAGLHAWEGRPALAPQQLAGLSGRAARSAIGTYGFASGGLLLDAGKSNGELIAPLEKRVPLPSNWRFVLWWPSDVRGLSGDDEQTAFGGLPPVPQSVTERMRQIAAEELVPAAIVGDFVRFSEWLYNFGHAAGSCFAARQGGPFAGPEVTRVIQTLRGWGIRGVGQSSWGPLVFALVESQTAAQELVERARIHLGAKNSWLATAPNNFGARVTVDR